MSPIATDSDRQLLRRYARDRAEDAFTELVRRHVDLVHSAALRQVRSPHLAEEIAQAVFTDLSRQAEKLAPDTIIAAWLYQVTRRTAIDVIRRETRRQSREQIATEMNATQTPDAHWADIEPLLDEAMAALDAADRAAVLLRYFENKSLREVGAQLGISDDAAQKRVSRAVELLREFFAKRKITTGTGGLLALISAHAVQAAPAGLVLSISSAALAGTALATTTLITQTAATTMNWINLKSATALLAAAVAGGGGTYLAQQHAAGQLRAENQKLAAIQQTLTQERDAALTSAAASAAELKRREADKAELLRLRGEVAQLRRAAKEMEQLAEQNRQLQEALNQMAQRPVPDPTPDAPESDPEKKFAIERINQSRQLALGMIMYAGDHEDRWPTDLSAVANYLGAAAGDLLGNHPFELVIQGAISGVADPAATIVLRSQSPFLMNGQRVKAYAFADGHSELKREPEEGFEAWENARIQPKN